VRLVGVTDPERHFGVGLTRQPERDRAVESPNPLDLLGPEADIGAAHVPERTLAHAERVRGGPHGHIMPCREHHEAAYPPVTVTLGRDSGHEIAEYPLRRAGIPLALEHLRQVTARLPCDLRDGRTTVPQLPRVHIEERAQRARAQPDPHRGLPIRAPDVEIPRAPAHDGGPGPPIAEAMMEQVRCLVGNDPPRRRVVVSTWTLDPRQLDEVAKHLLGRPDLELPPSRTGLVERDH